MSAEPGATCNHEIVIPVIQRPDYCVWMERPKIGMTFLHCKVSRWNPRVLRALTRDVDVLQDLHQDAFYALGTDDPKFPKFLALFGFVEVGRVPNTDGVMRPLYERPIHVTRQPIRGRQANHDFHAEVGTVG